MEQDTAFDLLWLPGHLPQKEGRGEKLNKTFPVTPFRSRVQPVESTGTGDQRRYVKQQMTTVV